MMFVAFFWVFKGFSGGLRGFFEGFKGVFWMVRGFLGGLRGF